MIAVLAIPLAAAIVLGFLPNYRIAARLNAGAALLNVLAAASLFIVEPGAGKLLLIDDLNIVFILLNNFVGFTTSLFSASYIAHEVETGRLTPRLLRFYHAMFQA